MPDDRILTWHLGMQGDPQIEQYVSDAYYPEKPAQCTDGAGIKKRYATTVATWPDKLKIHRPGFRLFSTVDVRKGV